jgi:hypothetical protein
MPATHTPRVYVYRVTFRVTEMDLAGFLDMMRYDGATVRDWTRADRYSFTATLTGPRFTPDRWRSFGMYPVTTDGGE